ncbi:DUF1365 family protein [Nitratireductor sp. GISD-1A_MAKvit]|uniref:DUF1365 domain-containing protein n=1 Tax=Nitratireductor sp. GISD-1A_MAKvit TaxID=3234198 RepID=UPI003466B31F
MSWSSAIYSGQVVHTRHAPRVHRLRYRVFSLELDLDELPALSSSLRLFGHNRTALFSFHESDHGDGEKDGLRRWVDRQMRAAGLDPASMRVSLLCYPRILGYVFNPLSVYFCRDKSGVVRLILYEVCNTFRERHTYVLPAGTAGQKHVTHSCDKALYVSPFLSMNCRYDFRILPPGEKVGITINETENGSPVMFAAFTGKRVELSDRALLRLFLTHPLMTLKITAGIHFEAMRLWLKGVRFHRHEPASTRISQTIVQSEPRVKHNESF